MTVDQNAPNWIMKTCWDSIAENTALMGNYTTEELQEALRAVSSTIAKIEKVRTKPTLGPSQRTLIERRLKALQIASDLISREIEKHN